MPKIKQKLSTKLNAYVSEFGNVLSTDGHVLYCNACHKEIRKAFKRYNITQHLSTQTHIDSLSKLEPTLEPTLEPIKLDITCDRFLRLLKTIKQKIGEILSASELKDAVLDVIDGVLESERRLADTRCGPHSPTLPDTESCADAKRTPIAAREQVNESCSPAVQRRSKVEPKVESRGAKNRFACVWPGCERVFSIRSKLERHSRTHTGEKRYKCDVCAKCYDRRDALLYHRETHEFGQHRKPYKCDAWPECRMLFAYKYHMNRHYRVNHLRVTKFKCDWNGCDQGFPSRDQFDIHVSVAHVGHGIYACDWPLCGLQFRTKTKLQRHRHDRHLLTKPYKCDISECGQQFRWKSQLQSHMNSAHAVQKPYLCDWPGCEFGTIHSVALKNHKMRHTDERPFKCSWPQCEWAFRKNCHLKTHLLKHTGERPVACDERKCALRFQSRHAMKVHFDKTHRLSIT